MHIRRRLTRRSLFASAVAVTSLAFRSVQAHSAVHDGCTVAFVNGLLQLNPDCLLTQAGLGMAVTPPSHLVSLAQALEMNAETESDFVPQSGSRRKRAKQRQHERRKLERTRHHEDLVLQRQRRHRKRHSSSRDR